MKNNKLGLILVMVIMGVCIFSFMNPLQSNSQIRTEQGYQVFLDGQEWFCIRDKVSFEALLEAYKMAYTADLDPHAQIKSIEFKQKIDVIEANIPSTQLLNVEQAKEKIYAKIKEAKDMEIKSGDNLWTIAQENHISVAELLLLNPHLDPDALLQPGDKLVISPAKPTLEVIITLENTIIEDIPFETEHIKESSMYSNQKKVISEGVVGQQEVTYNTVLLNGVSLEQKIINKKTIKPPVAKKVAIGTKYTVSRGGGIFRVVSGRVTSNFGRRVHPLTGRVVFHKGIDIGSSQGNGVYAYAQGTVTYAGWNGGYGNFVVIDHGQGLVTRYGHLSALYVKAGQVVKEGQRLGAVGSTGASTGPHLHFEVLVNGEYKNPLNYL